MIRASTLQCHELTFDEHFNVDTVEVIEFCTVVDEKQDNKFMGTRHSRLRLVCWPSHTIRAGGRTRFSLAP